MKYRIQLGKKYCRQPKEVKVIRTGPPRKTAPDYNPYEPVRVVIGEAETLARPTEFDSEPVDVNTLVNKDGRTIRPVKFISTCPNCGHAIELEQDDYQPGNALVASCGNCGAGGEPVKEALSDPFWNPVGAGLAKDIDLDPSLAAPTQQDQEGEESDQTAPLFPVTGTALGAATDMGPEQDEPQEQGE